MKRSELEWLIQKTEAKLKEQQELLQELYQRLEALTIQEKERQKYISSKEIIDLIERKVGKKTNMSTIKRWADEGYLGEVVDEKDKFWALQSKQGKKRYLYAKVDTYRFLYEEKGYLLPEYEVLDRVLVTQSKGEPLIGIIIDSHLHEDEFHYVIQIEGSFDTLKNVKERNIQLMQGVDE
ncbi:hypothetical protein [Bacillus sp. REN10]|uniref:hypothetical protein n=1 Tax=Bacillus sp. REN10 TaxID=2782541 RepID=UPI00193B89AE|nr:hypothetical protein [Bacillus sp. REN10]